MSNKAKPGDTVELKSKDGGFYDAETGFQIRNAEQVELGERVGGRTNEAIMSGGLLIVSGKANSKTANTNDSNLPEDLPGRDAFAAAKMNFQQVKTFDFDKDKVAGVGEKTVEAVVNYLKK